MSDILTFPLDNTEYSAKALGAWSGTRTRGVFSADSHLSVLATEEMSVSIQPGLAWLKRDKYWGVCVLIDEAVTVAVEHQSLGNRTDAIALRLNKIANSAEIVVIKGSPSPAAPTRNEYFDDIYLATVTVRAGALKIEASDIQDQRLNESYCGIMRDGVTGIPTQDLYNQWQSIIDKQESEFSEWLLSLKDLLGEDTAEKLASELLDLNEAAITDVLLEDDTLYYVKGRNRDEDETINIIDDVVAKVTNASNWIDKIYPVDSIYMSMNSENPSNHFGGTWQRIAEGRTLIGVNLNDSDFNTPNKTGGEKTHKLIEEEIPEMSALVSIDGTLATWGGTQTDCEQRVNLIGDFGKNWNGVRLLYATISGGDKPHNNMSPYLTCYIWQRTA